MDDKVLRQAVLDELDFEPSIDAADIGVAVDNGVVTLTGHTHNYAEKLTAEEVVKRVRGVRGIAMEIVVRHPNARKTADDEIARRAVDFLKWNVTVPSDRIQVEVEQGYVTLTGEVDWHFQKVAAESSVRQLSGITGVTNLITIKPSLEVRDVKQQIEQALQRSAQLEADNIRVTVDNGRVKLEGKVKAWYERGVAERAAWAVKGVRAVEDHLQLV